MKNNLIMVLLFVSLLCGFSNCGSSPGGASKKQENLPPLKDVYKDYFPIGNIINIGIKIAISELDVEIKSVGGSSFGTARNTDTTDTEQRIQALTYAQLFNVFKENKDCITRVTMWGMDDEYSWKSLGNPCLWDGDLKPKQAFWAVADPKKTLGL